MSDEDIFDHEELSPEQRNAMEIRLKELCLDCLGDGWVYKLSGNLADGPLIDSIVICSVCKGTGSVDNNLPKADTGPAG